MPFFAKNVPQKNAPMPSLCRLGPGECIHTGYQAGKGLHIVTVKIDPHKFCHLK